MTPNFLIIGLQKSGTYWLTGILNEHPEVNCIPYMPMGQAGIREARLFDMLKGIDDDGGKAFSKSFTEYHDGFFADLVPQLDEVSREELYLLFRDRYSQYCKKHKTKRIIGEKTTEYVWCLDIIDFMFPEIKKICILRGVGDRIVSWHFQQIRKKRIPYSDIIGDDLISNYCDRVEKEYLSLVNYDKNIHCLTYEDLSVNTRVCIKSLLGYLKVSKTNRIVDKIVELGSFEKKTQQEGAARRRGEQSGTSHFRKGVVGDGNKYLQQFQKNYIKNRLKTLQDRVNIKYKIRGVL